MPALLAKAVTVTTHLNQTTLQKSTSILLLLLLVISCGDTKDYPTDLKPIYSDFENVWQERNLFGKVKKVEFYKGTYQNENDNVKPSLVFIEKFTDFGALKEKSNYDSFGEFFQKDIYEFDGHLLTKNISTDKKGNRNYLLIIENDTTKNVTRNKWFVNDSLESVMDLVYNGKNLLTKKIVYEDRDTTITHNEYRLDKANNIVLETQTVENESEPIYINENLYDENGNLTKSKSKTSWATLITDLEWENGRIKKRTEYTVSEDLKAHLDEITEFDDLFNPINSKIYENSELNRELKYKYEFDKKGNWINRKVSMKEHFAKSKKFMPIYIESRAITYWE